MIIDSLIKKILKEATSDSSGARGSYLAPLRPGFREFDKSQLTPFDIPVSKYDSPYLAYDSYDGKMKTPKKQIKALENKAKKATKYVKNHPVLNDEDGDNINPFLGKLDEWILIANNVIDEGTSSVVSGEYTGPIELGLKKWKPQHLGPFKKFVDTEINHNKKQKTLKNNIKRIVGVWEKNADGSYDDYEHDVHTINEDLAVWFGKKKKPKGSSQPKGPWVDICRKVNGKHPPCGRSDTDKGSYPKCRAAGVAGKMTDSEKKSACQQKRRAEKKDPQRGKGQKPVMVSHKKKTNENMEKNIITLTENDLYRIVKRVLKEQTETLPTGTLSLFCRNYTNKYGRGLIDMVGVGSTKETQFGTSFNVKKSGRSDIPKDTAFGDEDFVSDQVTTLEIGVPTDTFKKYLMVRFPEIDFNKTELNNILYIKNFSGGQGACRVEEKTSQGWIDWLKSKDVAFDLDI